ncbi:MAG: histidine phosphatase family protein [Hespellia sp.]|nr:histidine phosphatase family protein [Hespellia sp.]
MKIILMRHSLTIENMDHRFLGITDVLLSPSGAALAAERAQVMPSVEHVYISPLARCRQTAVLLWPNVAQTVIPELRETDFGEFEGKSHEELLGNPQYNKWLTCPDDPTIVPFVEDVASCGIRATKALEALVEDAKEQGYEKIAVVSHGGTLMAMLARHGVPEQDYYSWRMGNCSGYIVELKDMKLLIEKRI